MIFSKENNKSTGQEKSNVTISFSKVRAQIRAETKDLS